MYKDDTVRQEMSALTASSLKASWEQCMNSLPVPLGLRMRRSISWLGRAEEEMKRKPADYDAAFIFYWIAFNAAYASSEKIDDQYYRTSERGNFNDYFRRIIKLDSCQLIYNVLWNRYTGPIRLLLENQYVFQPFWDHHNRIPGFEHWEMMFESGQSRIRNALARQNTDIILDTLFDRLYVLRNQLIHGGATWKGSFNRDQVQDGARIMESMIPIFIDLMLQHPEIDWGTPSYPPVGR